MSQTISVGVVGPSHWAYMAAVMAECLEKIAQTNRIEPNQAPLGVYYDAVEFSRLALQATGKLLPDNPPASINAYMIAADLMRKSSVDLSGSREDVDNRLEKYAAFVVSLNAPRELEPSDRELVDSLRIFFLRLKEEGESEAYEGAVHIEPVPMSLR